MGTESCTSLGSTSSTRPVKLTCPRPPAPEYTTFWADPTGELRAVCSRGNLSPGAVERIRVERNPAEPSPARCSRCAIGKAR
jgi:hypothetical protein